MVKGIKTLKELALEKTSWFRNRHNSFTFHEIAEFRFGCMRVKYIDVPFRPSARRLVKQYWRETLFYLENSENLTNSALCEHYGVQEFERLFEEKVDPNWIKQKDCPTMKYWGPVIPLLEEMAMSPAFFRKCVRVLMKIVNSPEISLLRDEWREHWIKEFAWFGQLAVLIDNAQRGPAWQMQLIQEKSLENALWRECVDFYFEKASDYREII
jgi:hypothetical protein